MDIFLKCYYQQLLWLYCSCCHLLHFSSSHKCCLHTWKRSWGSWTNNSPQVVWNKRWRVLRTMWWVSIIRDVITHGFPRKQFVDMFCPLTIFQHSNSDYERSYRSVEGKSVITHDKIKIPRILKGSLLTHKPDRSLFGKTEVRRWIKN